MCVCIYMYNFIRNMRVYNYIKLYIYTYIQYRYRYTVFWSYLGSGERQEKNFSLRNFARVRVRDKSGSKNHDVSIFTSQLSIYIQAFVNLSLFLSLTLSLFLSLKYWVNSIAQADRRSDICNFKVERPECESSGEYIYILHRNSENGS